MIKTRFLRDRAKGLVLKLGPGPDGPYKIRAPPNPTTNEIKDPDDQSQEISQKRKDQRPIFCIQCCM